MRLIYFTLCVALSTACFADDNPPMLKNDPQRPTDKISHDLGITQQQFIECFNNVQPAPKGEHPTGERQHMNKDVLLPCLQKYNPNITNNMLDTVMDKYRPEGPN